MQRVYGIRTFRTRLNFWTFPSAANDNGVYPDLVLVQNYETQTWAFFDDCFTCFGYFYEFNDPTWADLTTAWSTWNNLTFGGGGDSDVEEGAENVIAGNQQGFVLNLDGGKNAQPNDNFQNGASLNIDSITNGTPSIFSSKDNNLPDGSWIVLTGVAGITSSDGVSLNGRSFKVVNPSAAADTFTLQEFDPYPTGLATGGTFNFMLATPFIPIYPGSVNINVGSLNFTDNNQNGVLTDAFSLSTGIINYQTGAITLFFVPAISPTQVYIRVVSQNLAQGLSNIETIGTYTGGGYISKTSNFNMQSKIFNFLGQDNRARLSKIDFYTNRTTDGEFQVDILADSSNQIVNSPLSDNMRSNIVKTSSTQNQVGLGLQTMYRLYANSVAQTLQFNFGLNDGHMATPIIAGSELEVLALNVSLRQGGRLV